jgi:hypothetical protein
LIGAATGVAFSQGHARSITHVQGWLVSRWPGGASRDLAVDTAMDFQGSGDLIRAGLQNFRIAQCDRSRC